jgi:hypothetical protein
MSRQEEVQYEQDNKGNERKKIDTLRAQEGMSAESNQGIVEVSSASTSTSILAYSKPTDADDLYVDSLHAHNSGSTSTTFTLYEATLTGGTISSVTQRSVPIEVGGNSTKVIDYSGGAFSESIAIQSGFEGFIGVGVIADHKEYQEPGVTDPTP